MRLNLKDFGKCFCFCEICLSVMGEVAKEFMTSASETTTITIRVELAPLSARCLHFEENGGCFPKKIVGL